MLDLSVSESDGSTSDDSLDLSSDEGSDPNSGKGSGIGSTGVMPCACCLLCAVTETRGPLILHFRV